MSETINTIQRYYNIGVCDFLLVDVLLKYFSSTNLRLRRTSDYLAKSREGNSTVSSRGMIEILQVEKSIRVSYIVACAHRGNCFEVLVLACGVLAARASLIRRFNSFRYTWSIC